VAAFAPKLDLLPFLFAVFAAELSMGSAFFDHAFARRMRALYGVSHGAHLADILRPIEAHW